MLTPLISLSAPICAACLRPYLMHENQLCPVPISRYEDENGRLTEALTLRILWLERLNFLSFSVIFLDLGVTQCPGATPQLSHPSKRFSNRKPARRCRCLPSWRAFTEVCACRLRVRGRTSSAIL